MTQKELITWFRYTKAYKKTRTFDCYMEKEDWNELKRLNHLVLELSGDVHNTAMLFPL